MISKITDLDVYKMAFDFSMEIFNLTRLFPKEEKYSLIDQIVRSSRSIAANIAEGWGKRTYENEFKRHLVYSMGSAEETKTWLQFAKECNYINPEQYQSLTISIDNIGGKLFKLFQNWKSF
jgi:four helix bundle protein